MAMKLSRLNVLIKTTVAVVFTASLGSAIAADATTDQATEKCYGVVKMGMNDCKTATASCAGSATKDNQADAFLFLPKGTCDKIVGGKLQAPDDTKKS